MFERAISNRSCLQDEINLSECSDESDEESDCSSDNNEENRPMSVYDMRKQAAEIIRKPESIVTATSSNAREEST